MFMAVDTLVLSLVGWGVVLV